MSIVTHKKQEFRVIVEKDTEGNFIATIPALPGCYTQARTLPTLKKRVSEVIALCLEEAVANPRYRKQIKMFGYEPTFVGLDMVIV
jgi:predicted RNase H-like HicB family nuclease